MADARDDSRQRYYSMGMSVRRIIIAALATDRTIGHGHGLPWQVPAEYEHFLRTIAGQTVIMGRKSWEIFGADLTSDHNLVVSRTGEVRGATWARSLEQALDTAICFGKTAFIAGGASIYEQALAAQWVDDLYLSIIPGQFEGDAWFPCFPATDWVVVRREEREGYTFVHHRRRR